VTLGLRYGTGTVFLLYPDFCIQGVFFVLLEHFFGCFSLRFFAREFAIHNFEKKE